MTDEKTKSVRRITVAIDASRRSADALTTAADIAARIRAELTALLVEDVNLWSLAELPFAIELDRTSGAPRRLDANAVARTLQADADRVRRMLQLESERCRIATSMKVVRGHYVATAMEAADETDLVVLGTVSELGLSIGRVTRRGARPPTRIKRVKPVWILYDGSEAAQRGLALARDFTTERNTELVVLITDDGDHDELLRRAREQLQNTSARYQGIGNRDAVQLFNAIVAEGAMLCILPRAASTLIERLPATLLDRLGCPLVVVS